MEPALTPFAQWIYDGLRPLAEPYDRDRGYPLAALADGLGSMFEGTRALVSDIPDRPQIRNLYPSPYPHDGRRGPIQVGQPGGGSTHDVISDPLRPAGPPWVWRDTKPSTGVSCLYRTSILVDIKPNTKYTIAIWARGLTAGTVNNVRLSLHAWQANGITFDAEYIAADYPVPGDGEWRRYSASVTTGPAAEFGDVQIRWAADAGLEFEVTGITWVEGTEDPGAFGGEDWDCIAEGKLGYSPTTRLGGPIPGIARQMNPDTADGDHLPWLGQFVGQKVTGPLRVADWRNLARSPSFEDGVVGNTPPNFSFSSSSILPNLVKDPSFEDPTSFWAGSNGTFTRVSGNHIAPNNPGIEPAVGGTDIAKIEATATGSVGLATSSTDRMPVTVGNTYVASAYVFLPSGNVSTGITSRIDIIWYDSGGVQLSVSQSTVQTYAEDQWNRITFSAVAPASAATARVVVIPLLASPTVGDDGYIDGVQFIDWTGVSTPPAVPPYFDGDTPGYKWDGTVWNSTSSTVAASLKYDDSWVGDGKLSGRFKVTRTQGDATVVRTWTGNNGYPVVVGRKYGGLVKVRFNSVPNLNSAIRARLYWYDSGGALLSATDPPIAEWVRPVQGGIYTLRVSAVAPASAAFGAVSFHYDADEGYVLDVNVDSYLAVDFTSVGHPLASAPASADVPDYFDGDSPDAGWDGVARNSTSTLYRAETDVEMRARVSTLIKNPPHRRRGTVPAILETVAKYLIPGAQIFYNERVNNSAYNGTIAVRNGDFLVNAPDGDPAYPPNRVAYVQALINKVKPAGRIITLSGITGGDWQSLRDTHTDWLDVRATFIDWAEVRSNPTKQ